MDCERYAGLKTSDKEYFHLKHWSVWAEYNPPGYAKHHPPVIVDLKPNAVPVRVHRYPIREDARRVLTKHFSHLLKAGILIPCESSWNTPILPVPKPTNDPAKPEFRPVQDLRAVNSRVMTLHPVVPNPYTILTLIPPEALYFSVLDLKDVFFSITLPPQSRPIFAFEWRGPSEACAKQYTWTRLPQGFKNSPSLFGQALAKDLEDFDTRGGLVLLRYVGNLLLCAPNLPHCATGTNDLLALLGLRGYKVSYKKAQVC
ncbi:PREDICTED: endogenous retrovirus group K member 25 Pol protein-like [Gekko japonicus]|uniref:ribonuclease H n=1 Tax=Gekko japonicus TaxID=146911 RepID=A0ABM1LCV4_GEKJA|nr:PREDICTED: endogenous retrovirus group K member 25 Pol protein-like [Gekko japonicus]